MTKNLGPLEVVSHDDGTVSLIGIPLTGEQVAAVVADLLAAAQVAATRAGKVDEAKQLGRGETIHAIRPAVVAATQAPKGHDQRIVFACGFAHLGMLVPSHIVRALGENFLALGAPDEGQAN